MRISEPFPSLTEMMRLIGEAGNHGELAERSGISAV